MGLKIIHSSEIFKCVFLNRHDFWIVYIVMYFYVTVCYSVIVSHVISSYHLQIVMQIHVITF